MWHQHTLCRYDVARHQTAVAASACSLVKFSHQPLVHMPFIQQHNLPSVCLSRCCLDIKWRKQHLVS